MQCTHRGCAPCSVRTFMRAAHALQFARRCCQHFAVRAVPYVYGAAGSNDCPTGSTRIDDPTACQNAAVAVAATFSPVESAGSRPKGCYSQSFATGVYVFLNKHATGKGAAGYTPLCAGAPASISSSVAVRGSASASTAARLVWLPLIPWSGRPLLYFRPPLLSVLHSRGSVEAGARRAQVATCSEPRVASTAPQTSKRSTSRQRVRLQPPL
jgi:hypothetical protein